MGTGRYHQVRPRRYVTHLRNPMPTTTRKPTCDPENRTMNNPDHATGCPHARGWLVWRTLHAGVSPRRACCMDNASQCTACGTLGSRNWGGRTCPGMRATTRSGGSLRQSDRGSPVSIPVSVRGRRLHRYSGGVLIVLISGSQVEAPTLGGAQRVDGRVSCGKETAALTKGTANHRLV